MVIVRLFQTLVCASDLVERHDLGNAQAQAGRGERGQSGTVGADPHSGYSHPAQRHRHAAEDRYERAPTPGGVQGRHADMRRVDGRVHTARNNGADSRGKVGARGYASVPVRVDYALTELGASLLPIMTSIKTWAETHIEEVARAQRTYDRRPRAT